MSTATATPTTTEYNSRQEIFEDPTLPVYDKAQLLEKWDREHPPGQTEREKILASGMNAFDAARAIEALPPEQPALPRLLPGERGALAEARNKLEMFKESFVELVAKQEQARQALEQTSREKKRLESTLDFNDSPGIQSLIFVTARLGVIQNWIGSAADKIRVLENNANSILGGVSGLFDRRFGQSKEFGGREWANVGFGALPTRITGAVAAIETELNRK